MFQGWLLSQSYYCSEWRSDEVGVDGVSFSGESSRSEFMSSCSQSESGEVVAFEFEGLIVTKASIFTSYSWLS